MLPGSTERMIVCSGPEELAFRFQDLLEHPDREQSLIDRAYDFARSSTWDKLAQTYLDLYRCG